MKQSDWRRGPMRSDSTDATETMRFQADRSWSDIAFCKLHAGGASESEARSRSEAEPNRTGLISYRVRSDFWPAVQCLQEGAP